ncbi:MAG: CpXC domain-containing protein [Anaerolineales bacterium]
MAKTQIACPRCRQLIQADVEQLFDVTADPAAKQRLLSGQVNMAQCPYCGFSGRLATPIVYHDADKELLLTYFPPELNLSVNDQERLIGPLINQVVNRLPPEKRKAYLLRPQTHFTFESLIETILAKDGITREMLQAQQARIHLLERLLQASSDDVRREILRQEKHLVDENFFAIFSRLLQNAAASGQENLVRALAALESMLLTETEFGQQLQRTVKEFEAATQALQQAGPKLTREKLLELFLQAPNDERIQALVSLTRPALDYIFFQLLTNRMEATKDADRKKRLEALRDKILEYVNEIDRQMEERFNEAQQFLEELLAQENVAEATRQNLGRFTQEAVDVLNHLLRQASEKNDYTRLGKLQKILEVLKEASAPPPEVAFLERLLDAPDNALESLLEQNQAMITDEFMQTLSALMLQIEEQAAQNPEAKALGDKLSRIHSLALRISMRRQMQAH